MWWWCPRPNDGKEMYVCHPPEDHDKAISRRKNGQKYTPPDYRPGYKPDADLKPSSNNSTKPSVPQKLKLDPRLKEVLCTNICLSEQDIDKLCEHAASM